MVLLARTEDVQRDELRDDGIRSLGGRRSFALATVDPRLKLGRLLPLRLEGFLERLG